MAESAPIAVHLGSHANIDDHLRNHGFLREPKGWTLSPAYDINPVPMDVSRRVLSTSVSLDDATGSLALAREVAGFFDLDARAADRIIGEVTDAVAGWEGVARKAGASRRECARMGSAFMTT